MRLGASPDDWMDGAVIPHSDHSFDHPFASGASPPARILSPMNNPDFVVSAAPHTSQNALGNTFQAMLLNHYVLALFSKKGRDASELFKRMTYLLGTLITVLFVCCLSAPAGGYLCPESWEDLLPRGVETRAGVAEASVAEASVAEAGAGVNFIAVPDMIGASFDEWLKMLYKFFMTGLFISLWAYPVKWCLARCAALLSSSASTPPPPPSTPTHQPASPPAHHPKPNQPHHTPHPAPGTSGTLRSLRELTGHGLSI